MFSIRRAINGISINGLEYLLDENKDVMLFESVKVAEQFLLDHGEVKEALENYTIEEEPNEKRN